MISKTLLLRETKSNYKIMLIFLAVLTMYGSMVIAMFDPKLGESLQSMAESMPQIFAAFGMAGISNTLIDFMANYLYGMIFILFPLIFIILVSNRIIARYIERGSMAYLLATPTKRSTVAFTEALFLIKGCFALVLYVTVLCITVSAILFPGELDVGRFIILNIGLFGVYLCFSSICYCSTCLFSDSKYPYGIGASLCVVFVLVKMISQVSEKAEKFKYLTPLTLFDATGIIKAESSGYLGIVILYVIGIVLYGIGIRYFSRRDLSI
ncbi:ABC transporter permease subunit [Lachnoclostridium phytofermentans]|uniref:Membrane protein, putative n=1 Tax=Lachnoclostridium phytofermentans (strain ATCC 700394 / DSM 18823 / ISDg) TaxID=357809 RepID=A9KRD3_LACP7|nr:ABC transporter permease subunit [Lachnoclostridium phytofermentans]ABX42007.1 membrane protein, putative [Lachnoclostridium phytofermentans ISDg]